MRLPAGRQGLRNVSSWERQEYNRFYVRLRACPPNISFGGWALCALRFSEIMKEGKDEGLEEAKELLKEGLRKIFQAAKKASERVVEGFREGYAEDVTKKEK
jgi:hypothetical protein